VYLARCAEHVEDVVVHAGAIRRSDPGARLGVTDGARTLELEILGLMATFGVDEILQCGRIACDGDVAADHRAVDGAEALHLAAQGNFTRYRIGLRVACRKGGGNDRKCKFSSHWTSPLFLTGF